MSDIAFDYTELFLTTPYTAGDLTLDCYAKNDTYKLTDQKTSSLITEFYICGIDRDDETKFMGMKISNVVTNGTWQGATRYTATFATSDGSNPMVALANSYDGTTADANIITALKLSSLKTDSLLLCSVGSGVFRRLEGSFVSATTSETISLGSGEAFAIRSQISLHTDGAYYKYHKTNYPNWVGTAGSATAGVGESFTLRRPGYRVPGYSALTIGGDVFTDNGGTTVQTATTTTKYIGTAHSATEVDLKATAPAGTQLTQVNVEDDTSTAFGEVSGQRLEQFAIARTDLSGDSSFLDEDDMASDSDTKTVSQQSIVAYMRRVKIFFSTMFENLSIFYEIGTGNAASINNGGLLLSTSAVANKYSSIQYRVTNAWGVMDGNVVWSTIANPSAFATDSEFISVGMIGAGATVDKDSIGNGYGFVFQRVGGALNLYAINADGSANTQTLLQTFVNSTHYALTAVKNGNTDIKFYVDGTLKATHTTNMPIQAGTQYISFNAANDSSSGVDILAQIKYFSLEKW